MRWQYPVTRRFLNGETQPTQVGYYTVYCVRQTGRSETSQYPEEKTSKEIPQVAASERGGADQFYSSKMAWESQP